MTGCSECSINKKPAFKGNADLTVALAGNANVGKSTLFNQLTGVDQVIGNWPGKTVERAEGMLQHAGLKIKVIDLPGIYSFSTFSMEESISRDYIALENPDVVVNVIDATALERNLFFTFQLIELNAKVIIALNQMDLLEKKGITIDAKELQKLLGVPVIAISAINAKGIVELTKQIIQTSKSAKTAPKIKYGREVEEKIGKLTRDLKGEQLKYARRWTAIKLLEKDPEITKLLKGEKIVQTANALSKKLEKIHGHACSVLITSERYSLADEIARRTQKIDNKKTTWTDKIDHIALHPVLGYFMIALVLGGLLWWTFVIGFEISGFLSYWLSKIEHLEPVVSGSFWRILWNGAFAGFVAGVTLLIPYVLPFYLLLAFLEDSGYLTRIAVMLDRGMHKLGLHGKAIIPLILGYGCSVPACFSCRIMETKKQKLLSAFLVTLIPCTARTVVILGLVAAFVNIWWALGLFAFDILLIILLGRIAFKLVPGDSVGIIMEMPKYHAPSLKVALKQTWARTKSLLIVVFPAYIIGSALLQAIYAAGWLTPINNALSIVTVSWLGLPAMVGILLIFGIVRKELTLLMITVIAGTTDFATIMTPVQMITLALVTMIYIPCLATILALAKEFDWKKALTITAAEIGIAILIGGIAARVLPLFF
ncbi:MAG: ferrous iron transport protein B [Nanoarchaeota archaeon]|nr:ferrous iron transport protein B [Nanoarchaeota archaeon]